MNKTKYVGEVGLDYSKEYFSFSEVQRDTFNYICEHSVDKVMTVHCRKAEEDIYNITLLYNFINDAPVS